MTTTQAAARGKGSGADGRPPRRALRQRVASAWTAGSYRLAAALLLGYSVIRYLSGRDGMRGPDAAWVGGHLLFLVSQVMVATILVDLLRHLRSAFPQARTRVTLVSWIGLVGKYAAIAQTIIDVVVGLIATDIAQMGRLFEGVQSVPGVLIAVYDVLPYAFYLGVMVQASLVGWQARRWSGLWPAGLLLLSLGAAVNLNLLPISAILLGGALAGLRRLPAPGAVS